MARRVPRNPALLVFFLPFSAPAWFRRYRVVNRAPEVLASKGSRPQSPGLDQPVMLGRRRGMCSEEHVGRLGRPPQLGGAGRVRWLRVRLASSRMASMGGVN